MINETESRGEHIADVITSLEHLYSFSGPPEEFWPSYLKIMTEIANAHYAILTVKRSRNSASWKRLAAYPTKDVSIKKVKTLNIHNNLTLLVVLILSVISLKP